MAYFAQIALWLLLLGILSWLQARQLPLPAAVGNGAMIISVMVVAAYGATTLASAIRTKPARYTAIVLWAVLCSVAAHEVFTRGGMRQSLGQDVVNVFSTVTIALIVQAGLKGLRAQREQAQERLLRQSAELQALNAQLTPHSLLNLLSSITVTLQRDHDGGVALIEALSDMVRYLLQSNRSAYADAADELHFMQCWIAIASARSSAPSQIQWRIHGDLETPIPRMSCAPLLENALKHGRLADGSVVIEAELRIGDNGELRFCISNAIEPTHPPPREQGATGSTSGIGLKNLRARLEILTPGRFTLRCERSESKFTATLAISCPR